MTGPDLQSTNADSPSLIRRLSTWAGVLEVFGTMIAVGALVALPVNYVAAHMTFFGAPVVIDERSVRDYWVLVCVLVVAQVATWACAVVRGARKAWIGHALIALAGLVAAMYFAVTTAGPVDDQQPEPPHPAHTGPLCYSGGDSRGCPGG